MESDKPKCVCNSGYYGEKCERKISSPCDNKSCKHSGICKINENTRLPECTCLRGYSGELCEKRNLCKALVNRLPCFNNGTCLLDSENHEFCECLPKFAGAYCEFDLKNNSANNGRLNFDFLLVICVLILITNITTEKN
jgi:hypothetical protein